MEFEENTLLSGVLKFGPEGYAECCDLVDEMSFTDLYRQIIYSSFRILMEENIDFNLSQLLSQSSKLGLGKEDFDKVKSILNHECDSLKTIRSFAQKIHCAKALTDTISMHQRCIDKLSKFEYDSLNKIFSVSENEVFDLVNSYNKNIDTRSFGEQAEELIEYFMENPSETVGLPLPWIKVNESIGGGMRAGVHLVGARAKVGKTSFAIMTSMFLGKNDIPVLILDTEMPIKSIIPRAVANLSEISIKDIETGSFSQIDHIKNSVINAIKVLKESNITHQYVGGKGFDEILSIARRWLYSKVGMKEDGTANQCLIIYDYFKLMNAVELDKMNETQAMGFQIGKLVSFSQKYNVPCLSFVQLNRTGIDKEDTSIIFGSDKLLHECNSFSIIKHKTIEEMKSDGPLNGNRKFITLASRYGGEHTFGEYVSMEAKLDTCSMHEVGLIKKTFNDNNNE